MDDNILRISIIQSQIKWENRTENLRHISKLLQGLSGRTDLAILPEMFSTGFSMRVDALADGMDGETVRKLKRLASDCNMAITGSFLVTEHGRYYNRAFFFTPDGETYYSDKRHLFSMSGEDQYFAAGNKRLTIPYIGWNICPLICYDLRFPVWSRNVRNEYDLLIYVANWPASRKNVWKTLLPARAIENMAYVCGVNRVGTDGEGNAYDGGSMLCAPRGDILIDAGSKETTQTYSLNKSHLNTLRAKFPAWEDADSFVIA